MRIKLYQWLCHAELLSFIFFLLSVPTIAIAQSLPPPQCNFPGCGLLPANIIGAVAIPELARVALNATAALAVIFGIIGGARYLLSMGREEEIEKGKTTILWALGGVMVALASHRIVTAILSENYIPFGADPLFELGARVVYFMTALLNVGFLLMIFWGGMRMVMARGSEEDVTKGKNTVIYAIVGAVLINAVPFVVRAVIHINP
ncbi:MAG TPA: pilin [Candidatus Peribacterales bacterium]|nr:pilin [Candidatus Peribacterales bacterium]